MHDEDEDATRLAEDLRGEAFNVGDSPGAIRGVSKVLDLVGQMLQTTLVEYTQRHRNVCNSM